MAESKPGVLTTEFYAGLTGAFVTVATALNTSSEGVQIAAMACLTAIVMTYILSRALAKA